MEVELKLTCTNQRIWENIMTTHLLTEIEVPESKHCQMLEAHYFDTSTHCLQKAKLAYRIRREGEQWVATVKGGGSSRGGLHERQEWNVIVQDAKPDITVFSGTEIGNKLIEVLGSEILMPILITRFERTSLDVIMPDGSKIEVSADRGSIVAGSKRAPILEVELELKAGHAASVLKLGAILGREYPLLPESDSKFYRGLKLAGLAADQPSKLPTSIAIDKNGKVSEGLRSSLVQLIIQILIAQKTFLEDQTQIEALHELRVALRRLRSMLEFSKKLIPEEQYQWYQAELRKIGQSLGQLRDLDVAYEHYKQCCEVLANEDKASLGQLLTRCRLSEAKNLHKALQNGLASPLLLDLWAALLDGSMEKFPDHDLTMEEYAIKGLTGWIKAINKQGRSIDWGNTQTVHKVRLQIKKIKYVTQLLQPVLGEKPQFVFRLETLQDKLGLLTDYESTNTFLTNLVRKNAAKALHRESGMVIGWHSRNKLLIQNKMDKYWGRFYRLTQKWE